MISGCLVTGQQATTLGPGLDNRDNNRNHQAHAGALEDGLYFLEKTICPNCMGVDVLVWELYAPPFRLKAYSALQYDLTPLGILSLNSGYKLARCPQSGRSACSSPCCSKQSLRASPDDPVMASKMY